MVELIFVVLNILFFVIFFFFIVQFSGCSLFWSILCTFNAFALNMNSTILSFFYLV